MICERARDAGDPTMVEWVIQDVLDTVPELCWGGREEAADRIVRATVEVDRYELCAIINGKPVGICVLVSEEDAHVGPCLGVMWHWVHPAHSGELGRLFLRRAIELAKENNLPCIAFSHRIKEGEYRIKYRRVHGQVSPSAAAGVVRR